jgi:hypothetical protein
MQADKGGTKRLKGQKKNRYIKSGKERMARRRKSDKYIMIAL